MTIKEDRIKQLLDLAAHDLITVCKDQKMLRNEDGYYWVDDTFYYVSLASAGDYDNSCQVERANIKCLQESFDWIERITGAYGWSAAGVNEDDLEDIDQDSWDSFIETVEALADYPCIDDEMWSLCQIEAENEAWESWLERDVRQAVLAHEGLEGCCPECKDFYRLAHEAGIKLELEGRDYDKCKHCDCHDKFLDTVDSQTLFSLLTEAMDQCNEYFVHESGGNVYLRLDAKLISNLTDRLNDLIPEINCVNRAAG